MIDPTPLLRGRHLIWLLGCGYFLFYLPYSALTKALTAGLVPGLEGQINGFEILPVTAMGSVAGMLLFVTVTGWWRHARSRTIAGVRVPWIGRETLLAAAVTAVIIGTTTLNYTFAGISIVLVLLLMRGGVLILSPIVDLMLRRRVAWYSWTALTLSLLAVTVALSDVGSYRLTWVAVVNLAAYLVSYAARFRVMSLFAKVEDESINRRYFIEEHMAATPILVALLGIQALIGHNEIFLALRSGFTSFLWTGAAPWAFLIGLLYEGLFIFGSMIYLDRREFTYCVPVNRGASLLAGLVASYGLVLLLGQAPPRASALLGLSLILAALVLLFFAPRGELRSLRRADPASALAARTFLFICRGNTSRSPMAAAICTAELARRLGLSPELLREAGVRVRSAGTAASAGRPAPRGARRALERLGVGWRPHRSRQVTATMLRRADLVFCMTREQRREALRLAPEAAEKILTMAPDHDILDPQKPGNGSYEQCAARLTTAIRARLEELGLAPA